MHFKMLATKFLTSLVLVVLWCQHAQFEETPVQVETLDVFFENTLESKALAVANNKRKNKDVWNNIKKSITNAWNALKNFAKTSKQKMKNITEKLKARADEVIKSFENHMTNLKQKLKDVIKEIYDKTQIVKKCLIEERETIDNVLKEVTQHLAVCITRSLKNLSVVNDNMTKTVNDTDFFKDLENKSKMCERDLDNAEECLNQVRNDAFADIEQRELDVLNDKMESRKIADDVLEKIIVCSIDAVIAASRSITVEVVHIARCIKNKEVA